MCMCPSIPRKRYRLCEPNNPDWWVNLPGIEERSAPYDENYVKRRKILSPGFASPRSIIHGYGVDDADIVKSDGGTPLI